MVSHHWALLARTTACACMALACSSLSAAERPLPSCVILFDGREDSTGQGLFAPASDLSALGSDFGHYLKTHGLLDCIDPGEAAALLAYYDEQSRAAALYHTLDGDIDRAKDHWFNFEFKEALAVIDHVLSRMDNADQKPVLGATSANLGDKRVQALLVKALILKALHRKDEVLRTFEAALTVHPKLETSDLDFPPSYQALFAKAKGAVLSRPSGDLEISSTPPAAAVSLNGVSYGTTPLVVRDLPAGSYLLRVQANRYAAEEKYVDVRADESTAAHIALAFKRPAHAADTAHALVLRGVLDSTLEVPASARAPASEETSLLALLKEAVEKGKLLAADKAILLGKTASAGTGDAWEIRILDVAHAASHRPLRTPTAVLGERGRLNWKALEPKLSQTLAEPLLANPHKFVDPRTSDLLVLSHTKKPLYRRPAFWVGIGLAVVGGTVGGILAATDGGSGGSASAGQGGVGVGFGGF